MPFTKSHPSPHYRPLVDLYKQMHFGKQSRFPGYSVAPFVGLIRAILTRHEARTILDYGSGAGHQYRKVGVRVAGRLRFFPCLESYWGARITLYDPAVMDHLLPPEGTFDGVISTDVLEHVHEEDLNWVIEDLFENARTFVFASVAAHLASTLLPDGRNAHVTVREASWWYERFRAIAGRYPGKVFYLAITRPGHRWQDRIYTNGGTTPPYERAYLFPIKGGWRYFFLKKARALRHKATHLARKLRALLSDAEVPL